MVPRLPTSGKTLYVRLYSLINGVWQYNDYTYTTPATASAVLTSPSQGTIITTSSVTFTWTPGVGVSTYALHISAVTPGGTDIYKSPNLSTTSVTVNNLPTGGKTLYVRLYSLINGVWQYNDYTF